MSSVIFKNASRVVFVQQHKVKKEDKILSYTVLVGEPFACISMDFKGMDESFDKNRFVLIFPDYLSEWPEFYPVADRTASTVAKCLADLIYRHGVPSTIIHES